MTIVSDKNRVAPPAPYCPPVGLGGKERFLEGVARGMIAFLANGV